MERTIDYLIRMHQTLINDYRAPDGEYREHCGYIAVEVGKRLLAEGKNPEIRKISGETQTREGVHLVDLIPIIFKGKWLDGWYCHQVCCENNLAYDPLIGKPVNLEDYSVLMFGEDFPILPLVLPKDFIRFVRSCS